ncbi:MAG: alpha/beta fold hydrolase [Paracoccaceae bacterium]
MPRQRVSATATSAASADQAWAFVRDFCAAWHPAVARMSAEHDAARHLIRAFHVAGEDTLYRERLTWLSESERSMGYRHVAGIEGVDAYDGYLSVVPGRSGGSVITMSARLTAAAPRDQQIAKGTQAVLDMGVAEVARLAEGAIGPDVSASAPRAKVETLQIDDLPRLSLDLVRSDSETLCLFLHGIGGNKSNWADQLGAASQFCQAAALDLRGYGDSSLGSEQSLVDDYCDDILRVVDHLGCSRLILCGLSYGAWIATSFAMRHSDRLAGLILSGGCTGMSEAGLDEREAFRLSREIPLREGQTPADFAPAVLDVICGPNASEEARLELLASMSAIPTETYADALRCFTNPLETFDFARLNMPVLLMTGEHDKLAPPQEIKSVAERIWDASPVPDVRFEEIAGAGHVCNVETPKAFNRVLAEFLSRVAG